MLTLVFIFEKRAANLIKMRGLWILTTNFTNTAFGEVFLLNFQLQPYLPYDYPPYFVIKPIFKVSFSSIQGNYIKRYE
jgi:hypothetical protein